MSVRSGQKSEISGRTGASMSSMASSMISRGVDIQAAVLMPIPKLLMQNIPPYFLSIFITQLCYLLEIYVILYYFGLDYAALVSTLEPIVFFLTNGLTLAVNRSSSEVISNFLESGEMTAVNTIYTYGLTISVIFAIIGMVLTIGLKSELANYFVPYLAKDAEKYLLWVGGIGSFISCFSTSMKPYFRVESKGKLEVYMEVGGSVIKLSLLILMMLIYESNDLKMSKINIPIIAELTYMVFAFIIALCSFIPSVAKTSGLRISSVFSFKYFEPFRGKILLHILKNIAFYYPYESRWALATLPVFCCLIYNEHGSLFEQFTAVYIMYYIRISRIGSSIIYAAEPILLALGQINQSVKRYDRVFKLAIESFIILTVASFILAFVALIAAPLFENRLVIATGSALLKEFSKDEYNEWAAKFNFLRFASIEGMALAPMMVIESVAIFRNQPWKLAIYSLIYLVINTLISVFIIIEEGINQPLQQGLYFADITMIIVEIPTIVAIVLLLKKEAQESTSDNMDIPKAEDFNIIEEKSSEVVASANPSGMFAKNESNNEVSGLVTSMMQSKVDSEGRSGSEAGDANSSNLKLEE